MDRSREGTCVRLSIERLAYGGDGVATGPDGRVAFVRGGCPGDLVDAEVYEEHARFVRARILEVVRPSPWRVAPPCEHFGTCGGCQWQHVAYPQQLEWKRRAVADALTRIGAVEAPVDGTLASPLEYGYRNKVELLPQPGSAACALGFARAGSSEVVAVQRCLLLPEKRSGLPRAAAGALGFVLKRSQTPVTRVVIRCAHDGETEVDVWTPPGPFPRALAAKALVDATGARTVTRVVVRGPVSARDVRKVEVLTGPGAWKELLDGDRYLVSAPSFFQVNTAAAAELRRLVARAVQDAGPQHIVDAYAGVGTLTLPLARVARTTAIESSASALADLRRNLAHARLEADVLPGDAEHALTGAGRADVVVVDPPRAGLSRAALDAVVATAATRLVYVSCDPATLARDAKILCEAGFRAVSVTPVDLFPQTYHVETVAVFDR